MARRMRRTVLTSRDWTRCSRLRRACCSVGDVAPGRRVRIGAARGAAKASSAPGPPRAANLLRNHDGPQHRQGALLDLRDHRPAREAGRAAQGHGRHGGEHKGGGGVPRVPVVRERGEDRGPGPRAVQGRRSRPRAFGQLRQVRRAALCRVDVQGDDGVGEPRGGRRERRGEAQGGAGDDERQVLRTVRGGRVHEVSGIGAGQETPLLSLAFLLPRRTAVVGLLDRLLLRARIRSALPSGRRLVAVRLKSLGRRLLRVPCGLRLLRRRLKLLRCLWCRRDRGRSTGYRLPLPLPPPSRRPPRPHLPDVHVRMPALCHPHAPQPVHHAVPVPLLRPDPRVRLERQGELRQVVQPHVGVGRHLAGAPEVGPGDLAVQHGKLLRQGGGFFDDRGVLGGEEELPPDADGVLRLQPPGGAGVPRVGKLPVPAAAHVHGDGARGKRVQRGRVLCQRAAAGVLGGGVVDPDPPQGGDRLVIEPQQKGSGLGVPPCPDLVAFQAGGGAVQELPCGERHAAPHPLPDRRVRLGRAAVHRAARVGEPRAVCRGLEVAQPIPLPGEAAVPLGACKGVAGVVGPHEDAVRGQGQGQHGGGIDPLRAHAVRMRGAEEGLPAAVRGKLVSQDERLRLAGGGRQAGGGQPVHHIAPHRVVREEVHHDVRRRRRGRRARHDHRARADAVRGALDHRLFPGPHRVGGKDVYGEREEHERRARTEEEPRVHPSEGSRWGTKGFRGAAKVRRYEQLRDCGANPQLVASPPGGPRSPAHGLRVG